MAVNKVDNSHSLHDRLRDLKEKDDSQSKAELDKVIKDIANNSENNFNKLKEELAKMKTGDEKFQSKQLWKLRKKLCPRTVDPPSAMNDKHGNLLTSDDAIKDRALEAYKERLSKNQMHDNLKEFEKDTDTLCEIRLNISKNNTTDDWTMEDLKVALKQLKDNKSRDPEGFSNELFKESVAGEDLLTAILKLMNLIKTSQSYPIILEKCNVTSIYIKKSRRDFENYRGVFRVQILRSILDRLTYNDCYYTIDENLTDRNVGARKQRSVRDNIFVLSAITNSVINGGLAQVQARDAEKCFDKLWLQLCISSLYEASIDNDKLNIENKNARIAVKINHKLSMSKM